MRKTIFSLLCCAAFLCAALSANAYEVVMKNGKVVRGDLVSQNDTMIVLKDASGIQIQLKKSIVDLAKTEAANVPPAPPAPEKQQAQAPAPEKPKPKTQSKKAARVYTQKDLDELREKHDLGSGTFAEGSAEGEDQTQTAQSREKAEDPKKAEEREKKIAQLQARIAQTQKDYETLSAECALLKTKNFQTDTITDSKGNVLPFFDTIKTVCDNADKARASLDEMNQQLSALQ